METATQQRIDGYLEVCERVNAAVKDAEIVAAVIEQIGKDKLRSGGEWFSGHGDGV